MSVSDGPDSETVQAGTPSGYHTVTGERWVVAVHRIRSLASRIGNFMALSLVALLCVALLAWYYHAALERPARQRRSAAALAMRRAQGGMVLPPLGPIGPGAGHALFAAQGVNDSRVDRSAAAAGLHPKRAAASAVRIPPASLPDLVQTVGFARPVREQAFTGLRAPSRARTALERRLAGAVFSTRSGVLGSSESPGTQVERPLALQRSPFTSGSHAGVLASRSGNLEQRLAPTLTPAAVARVLPSQSLILPKGSFIDCTLETAIDSTLPGMTTCITSTDTFGANGKVILLERGSQLVGETRGVIEQGSARVFVLWTQARTPNGVVIPLASPGTDALGRAGLSGRVNRHFWQRFGAAMLISVIDAGAQAAVSSGSGALIYDPSASQGVATEVLRHTLRIPPQVVVNPGKRIEVLVARDLDFRSVYALRLVSALR